MKGKRFPIQKRVLRIFLILAFLGILLSSIIGIISMSSIREQGTEELTNQLESSLLSTTDDKAAIVDAIFGRYLDMIKNLSDSIHQLYTKPKDFIEHDVPPPSIDNAGKPAMQRYLRDRSVSLDDVREEMYLLGNLEIYWTSMYKQNSDMLTSIYLGTERGLHLVYDDASELGVPKHGHEAYFDYPESEWYGRGKGGLEAGFTDIYSDAYGRGLMVSCYAPFFDKENVFRGVVCMDILMADIYNQIKDIGLNGDNTVYLIDHHGNTVNPDDTNEMVDAYSRIGDDAMLTMASDETNSILMSSDDYYYSYARVRAANWEICITISKAEVLAVTVIMRQRIRLAFLGYLLTLGGLMLAVFLIARKFSRGITDPLVKLGEDVMTISEGDLDYRATVSRNDEVGDLAERFNEMAGSLKKHIADLTKITAEKERIGAELNVATKIQADMLPQTFPPFPDRTEFDIYATMTPAREVGGDFYDFFMIDDDHIALVMADVSGKGVPAALFMVVARTLIKNRAQMGGTTSQILSDVNNRLCESNSEGLFVTVWIGIIEISTGKGVASNAGHEHPALCRAGGRFRLIRYKHSISLAVMDDFPFEEHEFTMSPGDTLCVYTDGVTEATNPECELFGEERLEDALNQDPIADPQTLLQNVKSSIDDFVGEAEQFDDITILAFRYNG